MLARIQPALQNQNRGNLVDDIFAIACPAAHRVQMAMRLGRAHSFVPQMNRQRELLPQMVSKLFRSHSSRTAIAGKVNGPAYYDFRTAVTPQQPSYGAQVGTQVGVDDGEQRLRGDSKFIRQRDPDAALALIDPQHAGRRAGTGWTDRILWVKWFHFCMVTDGARTGDTACRAVLTGKLPPTIQKAGSSPGGQFDVRSFLIFVLVLLLCAAGAYYLWLAPFGPSTGQLVTIAPGSSVAQIGSSLQRNGIVRSRFGFELLARVEHGTLKAGVYRFDHPAPMIEVYRRLHSGDVYTVSLTIPEGYNIFDIAAAVEKAGLGSRDAFLNAERQDTALIRDYSPHAQSLEGYLFPDTYRLAPNMSPQQILGEMVAHFTQETAAIGLNAEPPDKISSIVTLASLIERETPVSDDRPMVASVFQNRLARNMPLDTDPSVIYAALLENRYRGTIYASDLKADSPYNTYVHAGLPPGPICNPGIPSLKAAMHPAQSNYLYFVSDPQNPGHSRFAATLQEHQKNVSAYRRGQRPGNER